MIVKRVLIAVVAGIAVFAVSMAPAIDSAPNSGLKVVLIRHAEKPEDGNNLSCQGLNRSLQLPRVLHAKFKTPDFVYVPSLDCGKSTTHSRMFQTVSPFAIKYNLKINSSFDEKDVTKVAADVLKRTGTVLMVWEHSTIQQLAQALGATDAPAWDKHNYDSIWLITFPKGRAKLDFDREGISPGGDCPF